MSDERMIAIETRLAHQDQTLIELNAALTNQQETIMKLERLCDSMIERLKALHEDAQMGDSGDERPPHY